MGPRPLRPRAAGRAGGGGRGRPADAVRARSDSTSAHDAKRKGLGHMSGLSRRELLEYAGVAVLGIGLGRGLTSYDPAESSDRTERLIGDGSTADTGPQPHQPVPQRLEPGQTPPQFVVFSWDGAANLETGLFPRFRSLAAEYGAAMTFFLSGIYALPSEERMRYAPPRHPVGASDINFLSTAEVVATMSEVRHALAMDYNIMYKQTNGDTDGDPGMYPTWRAQARDAYLAGFERAYTTNRAPLFIGNHFEQWNGGTYIDATEEAP